MNKLIRNLAPNCLTRVVAGKQNWYKKGKAWFDRYDGTNGNTFSWGTTAGVPNNHSIIVELQKMSEKHCFYCGAKEIDFNLHKPEVDHFCPKTNRPMRAYYYPNLFLSCGSCNIIKGVKYHRKYLLKFDEVTYDFDNYYLIDWINASIIVRPDISQDLQLKARYTLFVLGINKTERKKSRDRELKSFDNSTNTNINDFSYPFFIERK